MRFLIQRVQRAAVSVGGETVGTIEKGLLVLVGVAADDDEAVAARMVKKLLALRMFEDENGKTNLSLAQAGGALLVVSQFTLYADCRKGNRPSFTAAGDPQRAERLYETVLSLCAQAGCPPQHGVFGAHMAVELTNDGPFTLWLDSDLLPRAGAGNL